MDAVTSGELSETSSGNSSTGRAPAVDTVLVRYLGGEISAPIAVMNLLIETEDATAARNAVQLLIDKTQQSAGDVEAQRRAKELQRLMIENANGIERIATMLRADVDTSKPARTVEEGIAFSERLFDWSVQQSEEASVALYSLGNPELLKRATAEIVEQLRSWGLLNRQTELLDIGCGIGRLLIAVAPEIRRATGIDVSSEMVRAAQRRTAMLANVSVIKGDGHGLGDFGASQFDVVIAVDSFPYLRQSGYALVERFVAESKRVLKSGGSLVILNYSYSEGDDGDRREIQTLAQQNGLDLLDNGTRPFKLWDGTAFRLRKPD